MFIENVITKLWEPVSIDFKEIYDNAMKMETEDLFNVIVSEIKKEDNIYYESKELCITALTTNGCPHNNRNGRFSGCSMCDYSSGSIDRMAKMSALKDKSLERYMDVMYISFEKARGITPEPSDIELLSAHDFLNSQEVPDELLEHGAKGEFFKSRPKTRYVFETRAASVTLEKITKWKEKLGEKVSVELGVEVSNDWLRNHWINKNTSNEQIVNAMKMIHDIGWGTGTNILIGIPGLTEKQSIEIFKKTFFWVYDLNAGYILCSPLMRKSRTLQEYIYDKLNDNKDLQRLGVAVGVNTGIPTIFTVFDCIYSVITEKPDAAARIRLSPIYFPPYFENIKEINKGTSCEKITDYLCKILWEYSFTKNYSLLQEAKEILSKNEDYLKYESNINSQSDYNNISDTISVLGQEISKDIWGTGWTEKAALLESELKTYKA